MAHKKPSKPPFDLKNFLTKVYGGEQCSEYRINDPIFVQGDTANAVFYITEGKVKLTVISHQGKEAVVAILKEGDFFGEGCLAGQHLRVSSAVALSRRTGTLRGKSVFSFEQTTKKQFATVHYLL